MSAVVFGDSGLLGNDLLRALRRRQPESKGLRRPFFSIDDSVDRLASLIDGATTIYNCVAYTNVDGAESNQDLAYQVNSTFPEKLALAANMVQAEIVHFSTDYVFSGEATQPYSPLSETKPINVYGKSKLSGEQKITEMADKFLIIRTSWLYGDNGECFPRKIIRNLNLGKTLTVVSDQLGCPTWTQDVATHVIELREHFRNSIVHLCSQGQASWYDFALEIEASLGLHHKVKPITSLQLNLPAKRPKFSVLDCSQNPNPIGLWDLRWRQASKLIIDSIS